MLRLAAKPCSCRTGSETITMSLGNLRDLYQQVILEHYKKTRHRGKTEPVHRSQRGHNPSCGDTIKLTLQLNAAGDRICDVKFSGEGCCATITQLRTRLSSWTKLIA